MAVFMASWTFKALGMSFTTNRGTFVFASITVTATRISFTCWTQSNRSQRASSALPVTWDSSKQTVQRTGASRFAQRQIQPHRRLVPVADLAGVTEMTLSQMQGSLKRFRRTPWKFQQTFHTPLGNLRPFVATIASALEPLRGGCVIIDQVVFEPEHLIGFLARHSLPAEY